MSSFLRTCAEVGVILLALGAVFFTGLQIGEARTTRWYTIQESKYCALGLPLDEQRMTGVSMKPTMNQGDTIYVAEYVHDQRLAPLVEGDVVIYNLSSTKSSVHRVVAVEIDGVRTKGDNNDNIDNYLVPYESITGVVCGTRRGSVQ